MLLSPPLLLMLLVAPSHNHTPRIGLKRLDESGGLILADAPGEHMQFTLKWFKANIIDRYLSGEQPDVADQ